MKKLFLLFILVAYSCSEDPVNELKAPQYGKDITLTAISKNSAKTDDESKIVIVKLGRKSKKCVGFGFCRVCVICGDAKLDENIIHVPVNQDDNEEFIELHLDKELGEEFDSNLYVDEDLYDEETGELIIHENIYELDNSLGLFGGYRIVL
ncbi:MAG TPA: hypothetical protein VKZ80_05500 [Flavobacterium sp.]|jgi:hypothetical protein|nr:hypothetical protein [Flavobacterium sp.]